MPKPTDDDVAPDVAAGDEAFMAGPYEELLIVLRREQTAAAKQTEAE